MGIIAGIKNEAMYKMIIYTPPLLLKIKIKNVNINKII